MPNPPIPKAPDGYYHPETELDVIALVQYAAANGLTVRVRGATHSVAWSIYTDPVDQLPLNQTLVVEPPAGNNINIVFDKMMAVEWLNDTGLVEVEAGCHLGKNPYDPFNASTLENSFLYQAFLEGWGVDIVGGITHQTVSGFTGTGSAGGSIMYGYNNITAFRVVDGVGNASWIERDTDPEFDAMLTSLGLLGVITKMRFQLIPMYNIMGTQVTSTTEFEETDPKYIQCPIDLFGPGRDGRPSMQQFLTEQPYSRMTWWPQKGVERVQIWRAERVERSDKDLVPYEEFTQDFVGQTEAFFAAVIFVLAGNTSLPRIFSLLKQKANRYIENVKTLGGKGAPKKPGRALGAVAVSGIGILIASVVGAIPGLIHKLYPTLLPLFDAKTKKTILKGTNKKDNVLHFHDWYWRSLCMDNTADDVLLCTEFCEIWVPIQYSEQAMNVMQNMFTTKGAEAIGWYAQEVYAAQASPAWLNPSYSDGTDEYKDGVIRFDVYWYRDNPRYPNGEGEFFQQYWETLRAAGIPFRHHWGKYIPAYDLDGWAQYYRENLPKFDDFMALRQQRDPKNVFFTCYWQSRLLGPAAMAKHCSAEPAAAIGRDS